MLELAVRDRLLPYNPIYGLRKLKEPNPRHRVLSRDEEDALRNEMPSWAWPYVEFALLSGFRQAEQFGCKREQIRLETNEIVLPETKSGYMRTIPLRARLRTIVEHQLSLDSQWLFPNRSRTAPDRAGNFISRWFVPALERAEITGLVWHDLRRTCATRLHQEGWPIGAVQRYLGHSSSSTTDRYLSMAGDHLRQLVARLN